MYFISSQQKIVNSLNFPYICLPFPLALTMSGEKIIFIIKKPNINSIFELQDLPFEEKLNERVNLEKTK